MLGTLTTVASFVFVLGVLVFVHELGHFLAAKRVGIRVLKFQLGFNPTIASVRRGDTEYSIGALPLGGYVKMAGDNPEEARTGASDEFLSKSKWERFQVLIMGPAMNLGLAVILLAVYNYQGVPELAFLKKPVEIGGVMKGSVAAEAGFAAGDRIVSVGSTNVKDWEAFYQAVGPRTGTDTPIAFVRNGESITRNLTPVRAKDTTIEVGDIGVLPNVHPHITGIIPGEPAEKAGLKANDVVVAVNDETMAFQAQLRETIATHPDQELTFHILRDGAPMQVKATPRPQGTRALLGAYLADDTISHQPGAVEAFTSSVTQNVQFSGMIFKTIWGLFTRETSPKQLMGPVAIAQLSGESAQQSWIALVYLMAQLSLNLGLLNLMPIPVLDGGHIFIMSLEGLARRDFSVRLKEKMLLAGFVVLMSLMVTVIYNDLMRFPWLERLVPWR